MSFHESDIEEDGYPLSTPSLVNVSDCGSVNHNNRINRFFSSGDVQSPTEDIGPSSYDPYSEYKSEGRRLETFCDWPSDSVVSKEDLAQNGFICLHSHDRTQCIFCRAVIRDWEPGDNVSQEHRKFSPECPFIAGYSVGNQPLPPRPVVHMASNGSVNIFGGKVTLNNHGMLVSGGSLVTSQGLTGTIPSEQSNTADAKRYTGTPAVSTECQSSNNRIISRAKYTNWESRNDRLRSFATWPPNTRPTPAQLVDAGLLYMGNGSEDRCKCFYCGGELYDWEPNDDPMEEHAKWFPDCGYVLQVKGSDYVQYVKDKQLGLVDAPPATNFFARPHILQVIHQGYTKEEIQSLISKYGAEKLVEARSIIQALEYERSQRPRSVFHPESEDVHMAEQEQETRVKVQPGQNGVRRGPSTPSEASYLVGRWSNDQQTTSQPQALYSNTVTQNQSKGFFAPSANQSEDQSEAEETPDVESLRKENEELKDQRLCKICLDKEVCITFLPCGHLATCVGCSTSVKECPICRKVIQGTVKTFWS